MSAPTRRGDSQFLSTGAMLEEIAHLLPDQGPLSVFVHHNTLHGFAHLDFHEAVRRAHLLYGAEPYLSEATFRTLLRSGRIEALDVDEALDAEATPDRVVAGISVERLRRAVLVHGIEDLTSAELDHRIDEEDWLGGLDRDLPTEHRNKLVEDSTAFLAEALRTQSDDELAVLFTGAFSRAEAEAFFERATRVRFDRGAIERLRQSSPETLIALALFAIARRLAPAPSSAPSGGMTPGSTDATTTSVLVTSLVPLLAAYLDLGFAYWPMPRREKGLLAATRHLVMSLPAATTPFYEGIRRDFLRFEDAAGAETMIDRILDDEGLREEDSRRERLTSALLRLPGWAGMFQRLERQPMDRPERAPPASLAEFTAVLLVFERAAQRFAPRSIPSSESTDAIAPSNVHRLHRLFAIVGASLPLASSLTHDDAAALLQELDHFDTLTRRRIFQEAYESAYRRRALSAIAETIDHAMPSTPPRAQFLFCIDDREESIRRHLEELDAGHATYGVAGFFGLAMAYKGLDDAHVAAYCPAGRTPALRVDEEPRRQSTDHARIRRRRRRLGAHLHRGWAYASRGFVRGHLLALFVGLVASIPLVTRVRWPRLTAKLRAAFARWVFPSPSTEVRAYEAHSEGATVPLAARAAADAIGRVLEDIGLVADFAPVIVVLGHGSSSRNNPHESAYDCGACGGRKGGANARLFASLANDPEVRAHLRERGIVIPASTVFVGGLHDTTSDAIVLHDLDRLPELARVRVAEIRAALDEARMRSAHERCRRFSSFPTNGSKRAALRHVETRAESIAEPRPEYGHATNAICVVGRRERTRGLFLDRRAFLVSYDPSHDAEGTILERILAAVGPVGSGINLEYYFSTVDNERYGCGTKLPHNVTGLLGVMNGHLGDLRTGLTRQMVELHEPMRLLLIVEAKTETLLAIAGRRPEVHELVAGRWIQLATIDPETGALSTYRSGAFSPFVPDGDALVVRSSSEEHYRGHRGHLPFARIVPLSPNRESHAA